MVKFRLPANAHMIGKSVQFAGFPALAIVYLSYSNQLCPSNYDRGIVCVWEGVLTVTLSINGRVITLSDHVTESVLIDGCNIKALHAEVENQSRDETYLYLSVEAVQ